MGPSGCGSRRCCTCSAASTARPAGEIELGGRRVDALSETHVGARCAGARSASSSSSSTCRQPDRRARTSSCRRCWPGVAGRERAAPARDLLERARARRHGRARPRPALGRPAAARRARPRADQRAARPARRRADRQPRQRQRRATSSRSCDEPARRRPDARARHPRRAGRRARRPRVSMRDGLVVDESALADRPAGAARLPSLLDTGVGG